MSERPDRAEPKRAVEAKDGCVDVSHLAVPTQGGDDEGGFGCTYERPGSLSEFGVF